VVLSSNLAFAVLVAVVMRHTFDGTGVKRNFWLPAMCACTEWYSTNQIRSENWWSGHRA